MKSRLKLHLWTAWRVAWVSTLVLSVVMFCHDIFSFGYRWGFMTGQREIDPIFGDYTIGALAGFHLFMGVAVAVPLSLAAFILGPGRPLIFGLICGYSVLFVLLAEAMASGYAFQFGATWAPYEPFWELFYHPIVTPIMFLASLGMYVWLLRVFWIPR